jgi:hypothetical protein
MSSEKEKGMPAIVFGQCALIINHAKGTISITKEPNFDDMIMVVDGVRLASYDLPAGKSAYIGATYVDTGDVVYADDMGLTLTYKADDRYMEIGLSNDGKLASDVFVVISDSEDDDKNAPLRYTVSHQSAKTITLTFSDNEV